jgi:hypothetical protein
MCEMEILKFALFSVLLQYNQPFADDDEIFLPNLTIAKDNG